MDVKLSLTMAKALPWILEVDAERRDLNSRLHSAGHLLDICMQNAGLSHMEPGKGYHFPDGAFVEYKGVIPQDQLQDKQNELEKEVNELISKGAKVLASVFPYEEAAKLCGGALPSYIPKGRTHPSGEVGRLPGLRRQSEPSPLLQNQHHRVRRPSVHPASWSGVGGGGGSVRNGCAGVTVAALRRRGRPTQPTPPPGPVYRSHLVSERLWPAMRDDATPASTTTSTSGLSSTSWHRSMLMTSHYQNSGELWMPCVNKRLIQSELPPSNGYLIIEANGGLNQRLSDWIQYECMIIDH